MNSLYAEIEKSLSEDKSLVEITIIEQNGSTPRTAGTKMLVLNDGSIRGTIGGGLYEAKAIEFGKNILYNNKALSSNGSLLSFDLHTKNKPTDMDMICGGDLRLLVEHVLPNKQNIELYKSIVSSESLNKACTIITRIQKKSDSSDVSIEKAFVSFDNFSESLNEAILPQELLSSIKKNEQMHNYQLDTYEFCFDSLLTPYKVYIFGAGHVSCELAKITDFLDFKTIVLDDRSEFCNKERFATSDVLVLQGLDVENVQKYFNTLSIGERDGIIIVTRGHARDKDVLECSMKTAAGYIGMIGSKSKRQTTYDYLISQGFAREDFERIFSPIGLSIGAQTPQEIAISISAQLIEWRAGKLNT